jgi:hypothetical protein
MLIIAVLKISEGLTMCSRFGWILAIIACCSCAFIGCGGNDVLLKPNYSNKEIVTHRNIESGMRVAKVVDHRKSDDKTIGTARVGMFDKTVPYHISVPVREFVKTVYDSLFAGKKEKTVIPVTAYIDTFTIREEYGLFVEKGIFQAKIIFSIPLIGDSLLFIATTTKKTVSSSVDVTNQLEPLIYQGIVDCGEQLTNDLRRHSQTMKAIVPDSASFFAMDDSIKIPDHISKAISADDSMKNYSDIGFGYIGGSKVSNGFKLSYNSLKQKDGSLSMNGYGYNLEILKIVNNDAMINGTMVTFGGNFIWRRMFSPKPTSAYFGLQGTLTFGSESVDYGYEKRTSFFFGPIVRETLGISLSKKIYIEAGSFQIGLLGSKMLPSDIGFTIGMSAGL